jgi:hypothetical protein
MNIKIIFLILIILLHCYLNMNIYEGHDTGSVHEHEPGDPLGDQASGVASGAGASATAESSIPDTSASDEAEATESGGSATAESSMPDTSAATESSGGGGTEVAPPPTSSSEVDVDVDVVDGVDEGEEYQFITNIEDDQMTELKEYIRYLKCGSD